MDDPLDAGELCGGDCEGVELAELSTKCETSKLPRLACWCRRQSNGSVDTVYIARNDLNDKIQIPIKCP